MDFPIKIMPFGDSITASKDNFSSYRCYLDHALHAAGIPFIFAGTQTANWSGTNPPCGDPASDFDHHHEGHSGAMAWDYLHPDNWHGTVFTLDNILSQNIAGTSIPNVPDMVLMHLGTNDLGHGHATSQIQADLGAVIDRFRASSPKVVVMLAQITPLDPGRVGAWGSNVPALNAVIPGIAAGKSTADSPVLVVDQFTGFDAMQDTMDGAHPNASGNQKLAEHWMAAIWKWWNTAFRKIFIPSIFNG